MTTTKTAKPAKYVCACGRGFTSRSGEANHGHACPIEQARSAAFVAALEAHQDPHTAAATAVQKAKRAAYYGIR